MSGKSKKVSILSKLIPFRQEFYAARKTSDETAEEWLDRLKTLSKTCGFGASSEPMILDKFITGLEPDIIDYLRLSADSLNIKSSIEIIQAYETQKSDPQLLSHSDDENLHCPPTRPPEAVFSEILIKAEVDSDNYETESDYSFGDTNIANDRIDDDDDDENEKAISISNQSTDSEFLCNKIEKILPEVKKEQKSLKTNTKSTIDEKSPFDIKPPTDTIPPIDTKPPIPTKKTPKVEKSVDSKASKPKRKYKQRAKKEKQTFECEICHYKCPHECHLRRHKLIHLNEKSFICHVCGKGFNLFINLNAHIRRHMGFKPHSCDICKAQFLDKTRLRQHMRTHTGEKPFGCTVCEKRFADRYYLKVHMRLHTGERPFECDICQRAFSQSSSLSTHKKSCSRKTLLQE